jgi:hypothetical protein
MARFTVLNDFSEDDREIIGSVVQTTEDFINRSRKTLAKMLMSEREMFFSQMIKKGFDIFGPPALREFTPDWPPYTDSYQQEKDRRYPGKGFFLRTGQLRRSLSSGSTPRAVLGTPYVDVDEKTVRRKINGKRVSRVQFEFTLVPAPRLGDLSGESLHEKLNSAQRAYKLTHYRGQITRPLFEPFLNWWMKYVIRPKVAKVLR